MDGVFPSVKRPWRVGGFIYLLLWLITAWWGTTAVDRSFDHEMAVGSRSFSGGLEPSVRIPYVPEMQGPTGNYAVGNPVWRARTRGVAVAPLVIVDAAGWQEAPLAGFSGYRVSLWFFGATWWFPLRVFWVS